MVSNYNPSYFNQQLMYMQQYGNQNYLHSGYPQTTDFDINKHFVRQSHITHPTQNIDVNLYHHDMVYQAHPYHYNVNTFLDRQNFHSYPVSVKNNPVQYSSVDHYQPYQTPHFGGLPGFYPASNYGGYGGSNSYGGGYGGGNSYGGNPYGY